MCGFFAVTLALLGTFALPGIAFANSPPYRGAPGVTIMCGPSADYSCTTEGYAGKSEGWPGRKYGAGYASSNSYGYHNCTLYAAYRISMNGVGDPGWSGNANEWDDKARAAGTPVDTNPAVGAVAQWNGGSFGHVGYVERVTSEGIEITDDNYGLNTTDRWFIARGTSSWPDWFIHFRDLPAATPGSPVGSLDSVSQNGTGVRFRGWATDPDTSAPIEVHAYVTPNHGVATTASMQRPDVGPHAFDVTRGGIIAGTYNVCAYGINAPGTPGETVNLGCRTFTVTQSPMGNLEVVSQNGTGVRFRGWATDPDTSAPIGVHAYVTPNHGVATTATTERLDVAAEYPETGANHGFDVTRGGIIAGTYNVCAYGINAPGTPGETVNLGCRTFTVT